MGRKKLVDVDELEKKIEAYFEVCDVLNTPADGKKEEKKVKKPYSLSGLLLALGLTRNEFEKLHASPRYKPLLSRTLSRKRRGQQLKIQFRLGCQNFIRRNAA